MAQSGQLRRMRPNSIRYTQDSIGSRFTDGRYLSDVFEQLLNRRISVEELWLIEVVEERFLHWALSGNRRLYLYQKLENLGQVGTIPVRELSLSDYLVRQRFAERRTTTSDGIMIKMRQPEADLNINRAIYRWRSSSTIGHRHRDGDNEWRSFLCVAIILFLFLLLAMFVMYHSAK